MVTTSGNLPVVSALTWNTRRRLESGARSTRQETEWPAALEQCCARPAAVAPPEKTSRAFGCSDTRTWNRCGEPLVTVTGRFPRRDVSVVGEPLGGSDTAA